MDIKLIVTSVLVPLVSIITAYVTAKTKTTKELIYKAKKEQELEGRINDNAKTIQGLENKVDKLDEHRQETNIALAEIKLNQINMQDKQNETQGVVAKIYSLLIEQK